MAQKYILARDVRQAHLFARESLDLGRGQYRVVASPATISGIRGAELHLAPGYKDRFDRFAMNSALKFFRGEVIDHTAEVRPIEPSLNPPEGWFPFGYHAGHDPLDAPELEFSAEVGEDGLPLWERPLVEPSRDEMKDMGFVIAENALRLVTGDPETPADEAPADEAPEEVAEVEPAPKRRRRRCKECGVLVDPDEVEAHAETHKDA